MQKWKIQKKSKNRGKIKLFKMYRLYSSVSFTPFEGMELINPNLADKSASLNNNKYFKATSGFSTVINSNNSNSSIINNNNK